MALTPVPLKTRNLRILSSGSLLIVDYCGPTSVADLDELARVQKLVVDQQGSISMLQFVNAGGDANKLDEGVRKRGAEMLKAIEKQGRGNALVIRGNSLGAMLMRTMVTGINALSRSTLQTRCFATTDEALRWLQAQPGQTDSVKAITASDIERPLTAKAA